MRVLVVFTVILFAGCKSLDSNLLSAGDSISEYRMAAYTGSVDFHLDSSYSVDPALVHVFTLNSQTAVESTPTTIYASYLGDTNRIALDTVIIYCHGYSHHMDFSYPRAQLLANAGGKNRFGVLMMDYRGFGLSKGTSSEDGFYADVEAAEKWLQAHGLTNDRTIMYGFSLGSAPATYLTAIPRALKPAKLILEAPFASPENLAQDAVVLDMPGSFVLNLKFDNVKQIQKVEQPFCWIHGTSDQFINIATNGEVVYKNYHGRYSEAHRIGNADHSTIPQTWGFRTYADSIAAFIQRP